MYEMTPDFASNHQKEVVIITQEEPEREIEEPSQDPSPLPLATKLALIGRELKPFFKDGLNQHSCYKFLSIDNLLTHLRVVALEKYGVLFLLNIKGADVDLVESNGKSRILAKVQGELVIINAEDPRDKIILSTFGIGLDSGDKAVNMALTSMFKYALIRQAGLLIISGEEDPDAHKEELQQEEPHQYPREEPSQHPREITQSIPPNITPALTQPRPIIRAPRVTNKGI